MKFETKDSGERKQFASGMQRDVEDGKTLWHLVASGPMLQRWAELLTRGAVKYDADNWMKAEGEEELKRFRASAFRHFMQWFYRDTDEDHAAAVLFNINGAEYVREKIDPPDVFERLEARAEAAEAELARLREVAREAAYAEHPADLDVAVDRLRARLRARLDKENPDE